MEFVPSITTIYLPKEAEIEEPEDIDNAPLIKDTLQVLKLERCINQRNECSIKFFKTAADEEPFYTQWYNKVGGLICGHKESNVGENFLDFLSDGKSELSLIHFILNPSFKFEIC